MSPKTNSKDAWDADTWDELQKLTTLNEVKTALKAKETQRIAHKKYQMKKQLKLERATQLMKEKPELFADIDEELKKIANL